MNFRKFIINLESRPDRKAEMQRQLAKVGWEAEFIKAARPADCGPFPSIGARGCFLSHLETLQRGRGSNILLMEDDLNFSDDFQRAWPEALDRLPDDWAIFYPSHDLTDGLGAALLDPKQRMKGAHFVGFSATVLPYVVEQLETILARPPGHAQGGPMHVDGAYSTIREQNPHLATYAYFPSLGYQRPSKSDITPQKQSLRFLQPVSRAYRSLTFRLSRLPGN